MRKNKTLGFRCVGRDRAGGKRVENSVFEDYSTSRKATARSRARREQLNQFALAFST